MAGKTGVRLNTRQAETVRAHIQATQVVKRVQNYVLKVEDSEGNLKVPEMSPSELQGARILLDKALPNLSATELSGGFDSNSAATSSDQELEAIALAGKKVRAIK